MIVAGRSVVPQAKAAPATLKLATYLMPNEYGGLPESDIALHVVATRKHHNALTGSIGSWERIPTSL